MDVEDNAFLDLGWPAAADGWLHASWTEWKNLFSLEIALPAGQARDQRARRQLRTERLTLYEMTTGAGPARATTMGVAPRRRLLGARSSPTCSATLDGRPGDRRALADAHGRPSASSTRPTRR